VTSNVLEMSSAAAELADLWEQLAQGIRRYSSDSNPTAETLEKCAAELRRVAEEHTPEWVPLSVVQQATDMPRTTLMRHCERLLADNEARKVGERWEITTAAALKLTGKAPTPVLEADDDLRTMARKLGRRAG